MKLSMTEEMICTGTARPFLSLLKYVYKLGFKDEPNYDYVRQ